MRTRIMAAGLIATLAVAGSALAFGDSSERRIPTPLASKDAPPLPKSLAKAQRAVLKVSQSKVHCQNLRCINKSLNQLGKAFTTLNQCLSYIDVARYPGYMYSNDGGATQFQTTALDTTPAGTPGTRVVTFECQRSEPREGARMWRAPFSRRAVNLAGSGTKGADDDLLDLHRSRRFGP